MGRRRGAGDGALYKRKDGMWEGRVDIPPGPAGKRRTRSVYSKDRSACADKLRKLQDEINAGLVCSAPATTVGDWLDYWLANIHRSKVKPGTRTDYARVIRNDIKPLIGTKKLNQLQPEDVLAMEQSVARRSTRTAQLAHHILNKALRDAVLWNRCTRNPAGVVPTPTHRKTERQPFSLDEARRILETAEKIDAEDTGPMLASRWTASFLTGARKSDRCPGTVPFWDAHCLMPPFICICKVRLYSSATSVLSPAPRKEFLTRAAYLTPHCSEGAPNATSASV